MSSFTEDSLTAQRGLATHLGGTQLESSKAKLPPEAVQGQSPPPPDPQALVHDDPSGCPAFLSVPMTRCTPRGKIDVAGREGPCQGEETYVSVGWGTGQLRAECERLTLVFHCFKFGNLGQEGSRRALGRPVCCCFPLKEQRSLSFSKGPGVSRDLAQKASPATLIRSPLGETATGLSTQGLVGPSNGHLLFQRPREH